MPVPQWRQLVDHVMAVPEQVYETWTSSVGWNNITKFGKEFGEDGVSWCVIFDWDMYHDVGLDSAVPKVDNVTAFSDWARTHGHWSPYPSVGAWVNLGNGAHTEIVTGFDQNTVYTKGGNSVQDGATDSGQGNGVWSHATARRSVRVTGYFAPSFPDGVCPPTADPADPRAGTPVASWRWTPPPPVYAPFPGAAFFRAGRRSPVIAAMHKRLVAEGCSRYQSSANADVWGTGDVASYAAWQRHLGYTGTAADGIPGPTSWGKLRVPNA